MSSADAIRYAAIVALTGLGMFALLVICVWLGGQF